MVARIIGPRQRRLTHGFLQLESHYLFDHHFCLVRRPNEEGVVEGTVKFTRLNFASSRFRAGPRSSTN